MLVKRTPLPIFVATALALLPLTACHKPDNSALSIAVVGAPDDPLQTGAQLSPAAQLVHAATGEGLVAFDEQGRVIPALADRWIVTDDGQSYIFRLRDGTWANGEPLTSESARRSLQASLRALNGTALGLDLGGIDEVRAMAARVIEIRLRRPMPYLLQLLAQPELGLTHARRGAGPMTLEHDDRSGDWVTLRPIDPDRLGLVQEEDWAGHVRPVRLQAMSGARAVAAFNAGTVDLVTGGQVQDFPLTRSVGLLRGTIQLDPVVGLFGLQVLRGDGFLADPADREALAMAIDRPALLAAFGVGGWTPTSRLVTPGIESDVPAVPDAGGSPNPDVGERWADRPLDQRRGAAAQRVRAWIAGHAGNPVRLSVTLPPGEGSDALFQHLAVDMATIGVTLVRAGLGEEADLALLDDVARYPRASWFLHRLSCGVSRGECSQQADATLAQADAAATPNARAALLAQAEAQLTAANVFIPFGTPIRWSLVRGTVRGFATNPWGWHPLMPLAHLPK